VFFGIFALDRIENHSRIDGRHDDDTRTLKMTHRRITVTIQVCNIHRVRVMVKKIREWITISLEEVLVEGDWCQKGDRIPGPRYTENGDGGGWAGGRGPVVRG
jgi:hypothetical protein